MAQQLDLPAAHRDDPARAEPLGAAVLAVGARGGRRHHEQHRGEEGADHRAYLRSISARIRSTRKPACTMRDASSASSWQMSQVAAWPSVKQESRLLWPMVLSHSQ